jgi:MFS family permease
VAVSGTSLLLFGWVHNTPQEVNELHKDFKSNLEYRFGFGPLVWAPLSEIYGRKWPTIAPCFIAAFFSFATASAKDIQTVLITRFLCGFFGAAPIVSTGGVLADLWDANHRGYAIAGYSLAVAAGPVCIICWNLSSNKADTV